MAGASNQLGEGCGGHTLSRGFVAEEADTHLATVMQATWPGLCNDPGMRILVCNDDGIYSPGIAALAEVAAEFGTSG